jgi:dTDP-4-dehydrorhamnose reductase
MRILVTGKNGQLGRSLHKLVSEKKYDNEFIFVGREELDLSSESGINHYFDNNDKFDIIINCAAYTQVDKAEQEAELANQINHLAVKQLASIANKQQARLIHISTDYVFNGRQYQPYIETDDVEPQGVYGKTKLSGEQVIQNNLKSNAIIIRTSWIYSEYGNNFVKTMLKLGNELESLNVIFDQVGTPTYAGDLAKVIIFIVRSNTFSQTDFKTQIYHFSNEGVCSWYDFAKTIFELTNTQCQVSSIETKDYPTPGTRPHYSVLNKSKIKQSYNLVIPYWKDSLKQCLDK